MRKRLVYFGHWTNPLGEEMLSKDENTEMAFYERGLSVEETKAALATANGYLLSLREIEVNAELLKECPNLLAVGSRVAGFEAVDVDACTEAGVLVVNQGGIGNEPVAEHVIAAMISLSKNIPQADRALRAGHIKGPGEFTGNDVMHRTMGVIGMGNIGARVTDICKVAFQMRVLVHDPYLSDEEIAERGGEPCSLDDLMSESDYITLHVPLSEKTRGMIGKKEFAMMKSTAYFINTSRGPNIDEAALTVALREGALAGAALDVWDPEPPLPDNPLLAMDNVLATQHVSGPTFQAHAAMSESAALQWAAIFRGEKPPRLANPEAWPNYVERYTRIVGEPPQEG